MPVTGRGPSRADPTSAARDRRQDRQLAAVGHRRLQAVEEADVLAAEVDVDEPAQVAVRVEALAQLLVRAKDGLQRVADRGALGLDGGGAARGVAQLRRELDR